MINLDKKKLIRATRLIIALSTGSIASYLLQIPMSGWVMITACVVLFDQDTVGGTINRSKLRFMATFYGAMISLGCIFFFPHNLVLIWLAIGLTTFICAYIYMSTPKSYIGLLGSMTLVIILIGSHGPNLHTAIYRTMDIGIGVLFALLSMLLFFPEYALERANTLTLKSLGEINKLMKTIKDEHDLEKIRQHTQTVEMTLLQDITNFNKTIDDAKHELKARKHPELIEKYSQSLLQIRRLYRLLMFIFYYEIDQSHMDNQKLHLIIAQISTVIDTFYVPKNESAQIDLVQYEKLEQLIIETKEETLKKALLHFVVELKKLNLLMIK
ncbi:FUSC family protein [Aquella oligotrophica]|uniref:FUSC family protein n=1 Tax=Aquella oligotrophica TaxID=2067065 RepID=A0A2I7N5F3_9NEIS|nr:FUSC family protein [Aquella oligotrophica]AUR51703.1 hypothetical protein CUN60_05140 [Aquella oligotrophica]